MTLASFMLFLIPVLLGSLLIHLLWPERKGMALLLKLSLGIGAGLGVSAILYLITLLIAPGRSNVVAIQIALVIGLLMIVILRERRQAWRGFGIPSLSRLRWGLLGLNFIALILSALVFFNLTKARPQGAFDAWSIWNRAARFIYRDPENWRATLSPDLYWAAHADYPLLVPLNVVWGWQAIGMETQRVPMMQGALFMYASVGLMFAAVGLSRSLGQAGLASLVLMASPIFLISGTGLIADVPVAYFISAAVALMYLYFLFKHSALLILSGFMTGLGAWTKNEGLLFVAVSLLVLIWAVRRDGPRPLLLYLTGLAVPMAVVMYFKLALVPANDLFAQNADDMLVKIMDPSRYWTILKALQAQALGFAGWPVGIFIQLVIYALVVRFHSPAESYPRVRALAAMLCLQLLGYCAIYVLTPYDLEWHLGTSLGRLILHLYPAALFLFFCLVSDPETIFQSPAISKALR